MASLDSHYLLPDLRVISLRDKLALRSGRPEAIRDAAVVRRLAVTRVRMDRPVVNGPLRPQEAYPSGMAGRLPFELPTWKLATRDQNGQARIDVALAFSGDVVDAETGIATLSVRLQAAYSVHVSQGRRRPMPHDVEVALRYWLPDQNTATVGTWQERPFAAVVQTGDEVTATLLLHDTASLNAVYAAMSRKPHRAELLVRMTVEVLTAQRSMQPMFINPIQAMPMSMVPFQPARAETPSPAAVAIHRLSPAAGDAGAFKPLQASRRTIRLEGLHSSGEPAPSTGISAASSRSSQPFVLPRATTLSTVRAFSMAPRPVATPSPAASATRIVRDHRTRSTPAPRVVDRRTRPGPAPSPIVRDHRGVPSPQGSRVPIARRPRPIGIIDPEKLREALERARESIGDKPVTGPVEIVDGGGRPSYVEETRSAGTRVDFFLDPQLFRHIYKVMDGRFDEPGSLALIQREVRRGDGSPVVFYQDSAAPHVFYYAPESFLLARAAEPPFEPLLLVAFKEVLLEGDGDQVEEAYRVEVSFWCEPSVSPQTLSAARQQLAAHIGNGQPLVLSPLNPESVELHVRHIGGLNDTALSRSSVSFRSGAEGTFEMDSTQFPSLFAILGNPGAPAVSGFVRARIGQTGGPVDVPLRVSFFETEGELLSIGAPRPVGNAPGRHTVVVRNETDGTVEVNQAQPLSSNPGVKVRLTGPPLPLRLAPHQAETLELSITPEDQDVEQVAIHFDAVIRAIDLKQLWRQLILTPGYGSIGRWVTVSVEDPELYFGVAPDSGVGPLTELRVEFYGQDSILLTAAAPSGEVWLRTPLLDSLMDEPQSDGFLYRVVNIHGGIEGASLAWRQAGGDTLRVTPALGIQ